MEKAIGVITGNDYLYQKIFLCLCDKASVYRIDGDEGVDTVIFDCDSVLGEPREGYITVGKRDGCRLKAPFSEQELIEALNHSKKSAALTVGDRCAYLRGKKIKLTELELSLLHRLIAAKGEFVDRAQLLRDVWGGETEGGVVNVYVHYLREKLEAEGEKIILSSRRQGYAISEKYLKEE